MNRVTNGYAYGNGNGENQGGVNSNGQMNGSTRLQAPYRNKLYS